MQCVIEKGRALARAAFMKSLLKRLMLGLARSIFFGLHLVKFAERPNAQAAFNYHNNMAPPSCVRVTVARGPRTKRMPVPYIISLLATELLWKFEPVIIIKFHRSS